MIIFETERLLVRNFDFNDGDNFFLMNGDPEVVRYIRPAKTRAECDVFLTDVIKYSIKNPLFGRWAVEEKQESKFTGICAIIPIDNTDKFQIGYSLLKRSWGKGYATELTRHGIQYFFQHTSQDALYAITETANVDSAKVLLKCGFALNKTYVDKDKELQEFVLNRHFGG